MLIGKRASLEESGVPLLVFQALQEMDLEASTKTIATGYTEAGWATGLLNYSQHEFNLYPARRKKKSDDERAWCRRLRDMLQTKFGLALAASIDEPYPAQRTTCDLVVPIAESCRLWVEVKGAWRYRYWPWPELSRFPNYRKHLITDKYESVVADFKKLRTLRGRGATLVAVLLIGFDAEGVLCCSITDADIAEVKHLAWLPQENWREEYTWWPDTHWNAQSQHKNESFRVRCWFWWRSVAP